MHCCAVLTTTAACMTLIIMCTVVVIVHTYTPQCMPTNNQWSPPFLYRSVMESFLTPTSCTPSTITPSSPLTRTSDHVKSAALAAGLTSTQGPVQLLTFSSQLNCDDFNLLEAPPQVLSTLSKGERYACVKNASTYTGKVTNVGVWCSVFSYYVTHAMSPSGVSCVRV